MTKRFSLGGNLSEGSVSRYEAGKVEDATTRKLHEFAEVLGVETSWLIGLKTEEEIEYKTKEILKKAQGMPDDVMYAFLDMLDANIRIYKERNDVLKTIISMNILFNVICKKREA